MRENSVHTFAFLWAAIPCCLLHTIQNQAFSQQRSSRKLSAQSQGKALRTGQENTWPGRKQQFLRDLSGEQKSKEDHMEQETGKV